jgi:hypothetical protein
MKHTERADASFNVRLSRAACSNAIPCAPTLTSRVGQHGRCPAACPGAVCEAERGVKQHKYPSPNNVVPLASTCWCSFVLVVDSCVARGSWPMSLHLFAVGLTANSSAGC